jgi:UDP-3-O-[3-hydroxymyristoyl] N-acetylglucosamine deacetylase
MGRQAEQTTVARPLSKEGIGLHSGEKCSVSVLPAEADAGVVFVTGDGVAIPATPEFVVGTERGTRLGRGEAAVGSVEHLMAALLGVGVDNVRIEVDGPELPACDGSAAEWVALLGAAGLTKLPARRNVMRLRRDVWVVDGDSWAVASPDGGGLSLAVGVDYEGTAAGRQTLWIRLTRRRFARQLAPARTFALVRELSALRSRGLAQGGDNSNAFAIGEETYSGPLRFEDEVVRHKALDLLGDLALCGRRFHGHIWAVKPSHATNVRLARALRRALNGEMG